jgi:hypothetical protein
MALVSLCGVSDLSSIMFDYSDGVWFQEMMQLMTLIVMMVLMIYVVALMHTCKRELSPAHLVCPRRHNV